MVVVEEKEKESPSSASPLQRPPLQRPPPTPPPLLLGQCCADTTDTDTDELGLLTQGLVCFQADVVFDILERPRDQTLTERVSESESEEREREEGTREREKSGKRSFSGVETTSRRGRSFCFGNLQSSSHQKHLKFIIGFLLVSIYARTLTHTQTFIHSYTHSQTSCTHQPDRQPANGHA